MSKVEIQNDSQEAPVVGKEAGTEPRDLRAELKMNLESEFRSNLADAGTLPDAVQKSLVALLGSSAPTSAEILKALALEDSVSPEVPGE